MKGSTKSSRHTSTLGAPGGLETEAEWLRLTKPERVDTWLKLKMRRLDANIIAQDNLASLLALKQTQGMTADSYCEKFETLSSVAKLSGQVAFDAIPAELSSEAEECKLLVDGLTPKLRRYVKADH